MPWSTQNGGGGWRGGNGNGPWGQGPRNTGSQTPDLEDLLRRSQDRLRRVLPGGGGGSGRGLSPLALVAIIVVGAALVGYNFFTFRVEPEEVGIVLRFGEMNRQVQPGLNFRLPYPIEAVYTPKVTRRNQITIGQAADARSSGRDVPEESLMLTGDENIVDVDFTVFWVIRNASDYLFNVVNPEASVKAVAESAMREVVGESEINRLLGEDRTKAELDTQRLMQEALDRYGAGIQVTEVQLLKVDPPAEVIAAFRDVQAARADNERLQNEARTYANRVIPEANGEAARIVAGAEAYRAQVTAEATGQADRFVKVYESYRQAPDVTRQRIYLDTMAGVLGNMDKIIIDENGGQGVVPYLPLGDISSGRTAPASNGGNR